MTKCIASKSAAAVASRLSGPYTTKRAAVAGMGRFAAKHGLKLDQFELKEIDGAHHYFQIETAIAVPPLKLVEARVEPELGVSHSAALVKTLGTSAPSAFDKIETGPTSPAAKRTPEDCKNAIGAALSKIVDGIPACLKISQDDRKTAWDKNPPRIGTAQVLNISAVKPARTAAHASVATAKAASAPKVKGALNKSEIAHNMLIAEGGTTRKELSAATGWPSVNVKFLAKRAKMKLVEDGDNVRLV